MKKSHRRLAAAAAVVLAGTAALFASGFRVAFDGGRVHLLRKVSFVGGKPSDGEPARAGRPLQRIEILTPDPVILENMAQEEFMAHVDAIVKAGEGALLGGPKDAKITLTVTFHKDRETDNVVVAEKRDEEAAGLLADAVDAADKDVRTKVSDVSVRLHFDSSGGAPSAAKKTLVFAPGEATGPGDPVAGAADERAALEAAAALSRPPGAKAHPWSAVVCNPSFWKRLTALDPALAAKGTSTKAHRDALVLEARTFTPKPDGLEALYRSPGFQRLMSRFASGKARAATAGERAAVYAAIPFEVKGLPVTLIEDSGDLLYVSTAKGLLWLDVISDYDAAGRIVENPEAAAPEEPSPEEPAAVPDRAFLSACAGERGLFCNAVGDDPKALEDCLRSNQDKLLRPCAKALR